VLGTGKIDYVGVGKLVAESAEISSSPAAD
jgi:hypothetical protein